MRFQKRQQSHSAFGEYPMLAINLDAMFESGSFICGASDEETPAFLADSKSSFEAAASRSRKRRRLRGVPDHLPLGARAGVQPLGRGQRDLRPGLPRAFTDSNAPIKAGEPVTS